MRRSETVSKRQVRQVIAGLIAIPLSLVPFVAYGTMTPEGRLVRDRVLVAIRPPTLPKLSPAETESIAAAAPLYRGGVMVLAYHGIGSSDAEGGFVISPKRFGAHLASLRAAGMHDVTADEVAEAFSSGRPLPSNAVTITFDDGRSDAMMFADRLLAQARMSATMFVIAGAAARPGVYYASWDAIETYAKSGRWDIQSHTANLHREQTVADGRRLPALTSLAPGESLSEYRTRIRGDLTDARSAIETHTGKRPVAFAYPFGAYGVDRANDPRIRRILREEVGRLHTLAFHQDEQESVPLATADQNLLGLRRLEVEDWSGHELIRHISAATRRGARLSGDVKVSESPVPGTSVIESPAPAVTPGPTSSPTPTAPGLLPDEFPIPETDCTLPPPAELLGTRKLPEICSEDNRR